MNVPIHKMGQSYILWGWLQGCVAEFQDSELGFHWDLGTDLLPSLTVYLDV